MNTYPAISLRPALTTLANVFGGSSLAATAASAEPSRSPSGSPARMAILARDAAQTDAAVRELGTAGVEARGVPRRRGQWRDIIHVNVHGVWNCCQALGRHMAAQTRANRGGPGTGLRAGGLRCFTARVDPLFGLADAVAGAVRRRFPRTVFAVCALVWLSVTGLVVYSFGFTAVPAMILTTAPPMVLVWRVWQRGLGRVEWPFWGVGVGPIVAWAVLFGSAWSGSISDFEVLLGSVLAFAYATIYLNMLSAADLLRRRRLPPPQESADLVEGELRDTARVRLRRLLQVKILVSTCLVGGVLIVTSAQLREVGATVYRTADLDGLVCVASPVLLGVWLRLRPLAWVAIGVIGLYVLAAVASDPHQWRAAVLRYAWIGPVAVWYWLRADRAWYWPPVPRPAHHAPSRPHPRREPYPPPWYPRPPSYPRQPYPHQPTYPPPPNPPPPYPPQPLPPPPHPPPGPPR